MKLWIPYNTPVYLGKAPTTIWLTVDDKNVHGCFIELQEIFPPARKRKKKRGKQHAHGKRKKLHTAAATPRRSAAAGTRIAGTGTGRGRAKRSTTGAAHDAAAPIRQQ